MSAAINFIPPECWSQIMQYANDTQELKRQIEDEHLLGIVAVLYTANAGLVYPKDRSYPHDPEVIRGANINFKSKKYKAKLREVLTGDLDY